MPHVRYRLKGGMNWQKDTLQKDKMYYFKQQELQGIFTINNHIFDNLIQVNIKFTLIVYEYITVKPFKIYVKCAKY